MYHPWVSCQIRVFMKSETLWCVTAGMIQQNRLDHVRMGESRKHKSIIITQIQKSARGIQVYENFQCIAETCAINLQASIRISSLKEKCRKSLGCSGDTSVAIVPHAGCGTKVGQTVCLTPKVGSLVLNLVTPGCTFGEMQAVGTHETKQVLEWIRVKIFMLVLSP